MSQAGGNLRGGGGGHILYFPPECCRFERLTVGFLLETLSRK